MTNELATVDDSPSLEVLPPARPPSATAREMLLAHAEMMQTAHQLAIAMCKTDLVPERFRNEPDNAAAAILYGAELGLNPIQSLQRIIPIYGMPSIESRTMVALLKARGYKIKTVAQTDESVTVWGRDIHGDEYESTWTIERAIKAGYVPSLDKNTGKFKVNSKGKLIGNEKYLTDPQAMLKAKAQAEVCRDMAPDVLLGISYTTEELQESRISRPPIRQRTADPITVEEILNSTPAEQSIKNPSPDSEPDADDDSAEEPPTQAMNRKMHMLFRDAGLIGHDDRLAVVHSILGYQLDPPATITKAEASTVIGKLEAWAAAGETDNMVREILNQAVLAEENPSTDSQKGNGENK